VRAVLVVAAMSLLLAGAGGARVVSPRASCPASVRPGGPHDVEAVVAALRRQMPSLYKGLTDMGEPVPINPRTYEIEGVIRLGVAPGPAFARALRRQALQLCPARVVERSWAVSLSLARVQLPASARVVFLARTRSGWTAWYHS